MRIWTSDHTFPHPWTTVVQAAWRKYPNPLTPSVTGVDVLARRVGEDGVLRSQRLFQTEWGIPGWATRLVGMDRPCLVHEKSEVDMSAQTMRLSARNLTWSSIVSIDEQLTYAPHPADPQQTLLKQEAIVTVQGVPLTSYMEDIITSNIDKNVGTGRKAMEWVISKIKSETDDLVGRARGLAAEAEDRFKLAANEAEEGVKKLAAEAEEGVKKFAFEAEEGVKKFASEAEEGVKKFASEAEESVKKLASEADGLSKKLASDAEDVGKKIVRDSCAEPAS